MIVKSDDIRAFRPVAQNIGSGARIEPYILEVETLHVLPTIGAALYKRIDQTPADFATLLSGGYYDSDKRHFLGLVAAVSYLAYARVIRNQNVNLTAFGVVYKDGELSERADEATIARMSNEAQTIGERLLADCVEYLQFVGEINCEKNNVKQRKIKVL